MFTSTLSRNSTNVRYVISLAWQRMNLSITSALAPQKAVEVAVRLFGTPPLIEHTPRELELLSTGTRYTVASPRADLAAWRFGRADRPVVLLTHGWGGRGAQLRAFVPELLDAGFQVVTFDQAGHGYSDSESSSLVHFLEGIEAVVADLEANGRKVAGMVGHSLGAAATGLWLNGNRRELRAVLVAPPISVERYSGYFARQFGIAEPVRRAMQEYFERTLGRRWADFELPGSIARARAPALVIHDAGDREIPQAFGVALARAWPEAKFLGTHGLGHRLILRDAQVVRDAVDFITNRVSFAPPPERDGAAYNAPAPIF